MSNISKSAKAAAVILQLVQLDKTGDSMHRMCWPAEALARQRPDWAVVNLDARAGQRYAWAEAADLLVIFQSADLDLLPVIQRRKKRGLKTVVEYNDNFYQSPAWGSVGEDWSSPILWQSYELFMRNADAVIVTGKGLQELFAEHGFNHSQVIENHFPFQLESFETLWPEKGQELRIGWAGSLGHIADLLAALPVLRRIVLKHPRVKLCLMGNESIPSYVRLPADRFEYVAWGGMREYLNFLKSLHIGVAPLLDTAYNACRSDVKAIELGACGVLPVLTARSPYSDLLEDCCLPSFLSWAELEICMEKLIADPQALKEQARKFHEYIGAKRLLGNNRGRAEFYAGFLPAAGIEIAENAVKPAMVTWSPGYHEISGELGKPSPFQSILASALALNDAGQKSEAFAVLQAAARANSQNHQLRFQALRSVFELGGLELSSAEALIEDCECAIKEFPLDLRFVLLRLRLGAVDSTRISLWEDLLLSLEKLSFHARALFARDTITLIVQERLPPEKWLALAEGARCVYPDALELLLALAEVYESVEQRQVALTLFEELAAKARLIEENLRNNSKIKLSFVEARAEALRASLRAML